MSTDDVKGRGRKIPVWTWRQAVSEADIETYTKALLWTLALDLSDAGRYVQMPVKEIMRLSSMSNRAVATHLKKAEDAGFIDIERLHDARGHVSGTRYHLRFPDGMELARGSSETVETRAAFSDPAHEKTLSERGSPRGKTLSERNSSREVSLSERGARLSERGASLDEPRSRQYPDSDPDSDPDSSPSLRSGVADPADTARPAEQKSVVKKAKPKGEPKATRLPEDWQLSEEGKAYFLARWDITEYQLLREASRFKNYWLAKAGKDARKTDWARTFVNWLDKDHHRRGAPAEAVLGPRKGSMKKSRREILEQHFVVV